MYNEGRWAHTILCNINVWFPVWHFIKDVWYFQTWYYYALLHELVEINSFLKKSLKETKQDVTFLQWDGMTSDCHVTKKASLRLDFIIIINGYKKYIINHSFLEINWLWLIWNYFRTLLLNKQKFTRLLYYYKYSIKM
jgi:hypothetical protein